MQATDSTAMMSPHSSHSMPNTRSVSAADTRWSHPSPGPTPMRPPEAAADMVRVCWKPPSEACSHTWPQAANRRRI